MGKILEKTRKSHGILSVQECGNHDYFSFNINEHVYYYLNINKFSNLIARETRNSLLLVFCQ